MPTSQAATYASAPMLIGSSVPIDEEGDQREDGDHSGPTNTFLPEKCPARLHPRVPAWRRLSIRWPGDRPRAARGPRRRARRGDHDLDGRRRVAAVSFPVLLAVGLPPVVANATNTVGLTPGGLSGTFGYRPSCGSTRGSPRVVVATCAGGAVAGRRAAAGPAGGRLRGDRAVADPLHLPAGRRLSPASPPWLRARRGAPTSCRATAMSPVTTFFATADRACTAATSAPAPA